MRTLSFLFLAIGLAAAAFCFLGLSGESLPYQDPTPAMLAAQERNLQRWQWGLLTSVAVSVAAVVGIWRTRKQGRAN
jgi:hypothetical protein